MQLPRLRPKALRGPYLDRLLILRVLLVCLCAWVLDVSIAQLLQQPPEWTWRARAGLLGLLVPLGLNAIGLLWPFLQLTSFERHHATFHKGVVYGSIAGKLLEALSGLELPYSSGQQSMLLHGILFIVHQEPVEDYLLCLATMLAACTSSHALFGPGTLLPPLFAGRRNEAPQVSSSSPFLSITTAGEFFVNLFLFCLVLHHLYCKAMGPRLQPRLGPALQSSRRISSLVQPSELRVSRAYLLKLAVVKASNAFFVALYSVQYCASALDKAAAAGLLDKGSSWGLLPGAAGTPAIIGAACTIMLLCHAGCGYVLPRWYQRNMTWVNSLSVYLCLTARLYLTRFHLQSGSTHIPPELMFHSFLVLAASLLVHEVGHASFGVQLTVVAKVSRSVHLYLIQHSRGLLVSRWPTTEQLLGSPLELPEYLVVTVVMVAAYKCLCVGRFEQEQQRQGADTAARRSFDWPAPTPKGKRALNFKVPPLDLNYRADMSACSSPRGSVEGSLHSSLGGSVREEQGVLRPALHISLGQDPYKMSAPTPRRKSLLIPSLPSPNIVADLGETEATIISGNQQYTGPSKGQQQQQQQQQQHVTSHGLTGRTSSVQEQQLAQGSSQAAPAVAANTTQAASPRGSGWLWAQQVPEDMLPNLVVELCQCFLSLLYWGAESRKLVLLAMTPAGGLQLSVAAKSMAVLGLCLHFGGVLAHLGTLLIRPLLALNQHEKLWFMHVGVLPMMFHVLQQQLFQTPLLQARRQLLVCAAGMGVLNLSAPSFARWSPLAATAIVAMQVLSGPDTAEWGRLLLDGFMYHLLAAAVWMGAKAASMALHATAGRMLGMWTSSKKAAPKAQHMALVAAQLLPPLVLGCILTGLGMLEDKIPAHVDPFLAFGAIKQAVVEMLHRMELLGALQKNQETLAALVGVALSFMAVSSLQGVLLSNPRFRNPRESWYEVQKTKVLGLCEQTVASLSQLQGTSEMEELEAGLLASLKSVTQDCFPGCTLLLILLEDQSLESDQAERWVIHAAPGAAHMLQHQELSLQEVPSVVEACQLGKPLFETGVRTSTARFEDWAGLGRETGGDTFLVVPLAYATQQQFGAILLTCASPVTMDTHLRNLATELSHALSQTLYTLACVRQMKAGETIIHDVMPQQVAEQLRRRVIHAKSSTASPSGTQPGTSVAVSQPRSSVYQPLLCKLSETATALRVQQEEVAKTTGNLPDLQEQPKLMGFETPVAYKQWHAGVSVLFADISGYTAMSTQVEPEQVMLLLHELFSKYDHLCKRYGIYKVETIGDCYMACSGLLVDNPDHAQHMVQFAKAMLGAAASVRNPLGGSVHIRVGVHSGRVMSGIVGSIRARYCLFGDTVNTASRMESTGMVDRIQVSEDTYHLLGDLQQDFELREAVSVKGKGVMQTYVLTEQIADTLLLDADQPLQ